MKGRYRIVDPPCLRVLVALKAAFDQERIRFALVGGIGVQAIVASRGHEDLLRRTGDIDLAAHASDAEVVHALNTLSAMNPGLGVVQNPGARNARVGPLNVDYVLDATKLKGMERFFLDAIDTAPEVQVRGLMIPVKTPEFLIAAKLTGQKVRPQDEVDIVALLRSGVEPDEARLSELLAQWPDRLRLFFDIRDRVKRR